MLRLGTMNDESPEASPANNLLGELEEFRASCHATLASIGGRLDERIDAVRDRVLALGPADAIPSSRMRDIRDMLTLLHHSGVKPGKGRRKDLKKLDTISDDLDMMTEQWS